MSYILEALKKSQAERELGRVPTLNSLALYEEDKTEPKRVPWAPMALGLASLATLLALYAALRNPGSVPSAGAPIQTVQPGSESGAVAVQVPEHLARVAGSAAGPLPPAPQASRPGLVPASSDPAMSPGVLGSPSLPVSPTRGAEPMAPAPLVEAPPPKSATRRPDVEPTAAETDPAGVGADDGRPRTEAELDAELQRELERQLALESDTVPLAEIEEPEEPEEPTPTPVPRELIDEIQAFKEQVRRGTGKAPGAAKSAGIAKPKDPTTLRLTAGQQAELPPFMMTAHVYSADKSQRFVLINGLKYGDGDQTREDLKVEQILPNGAVLSYRGNPFYLHR